MGYRKRRDELNAAYHEKLAENEKTAEERTAKKREKRQKKKANKKKKGKGGCKLGPDCELCMPATKTLLPPTCATSKATIYNPSFRRVNPDYLYEMDDEEKPKSHRTSRIGETIYRRRVSMMKLQEMYHTLEFIEKFNKGIIPSK